MLKRFLTPSLIILLSITLLSCATTNNKKEVPGEGQAPEEQILDLCKKNPTADVCVAREGRTERKVLYSPSAEWLTLSGNGLTTLDKTNSSISAEDQEGWNNGWVIEVTTDYQANKVTLEHNGGRKGQKPETDAKVILTESYYDQDGKLFSITIHTHEVGTTSHGIRFINNGAPYKLNNVDFATTSKIFEMMTYEFEGQKYYLNGPPIYIKHTNPS